MSLVESLLASNELVVPDITVMEGGLGSVNVRKSRFPEIDDRLTRALPLAIQDGLEQLKTGQVPFGRIVIKVD